jgi:hypothetical protein
MPRTVLGRRRPTRQKTIVRRLAVEGTSRLRTMKSHSQDARELSLAPSAAQLPRRRPPTAGTTRQRRHGSAALATYRDLGAKGFGPTEAGNLTAYLGGLRPAGRGWTVAELDRLLFLRYLVDRGLIDGDPMVDSAHPVPARPASVTVASEES